MKSKLKTKKQIKKQIKKQTKKQIKKQTKKQIKKQIQSQRGGNYPSSLLNPGQSHNIRPSIFRKSPQNTSYEEPIEINDYEINLNNVEELLKEQYETDKIIKKLFETSKSELKEVLAQRKKLFTQRQALLGLKESLKSNMNKYKSDLETVHKNIKLLVTKKQTPT